MKYIARRTVEAWYWGENTDPIALAFMCGGIYHKNSVTTHYPLKTEVDEYIVGENINPGYQAFKPGTYLVKDEKGGFFVMLKDKFEQEFQKEETE